LDQADRAAEFASRMKHSLHPAKGDLASAKRNASMLAVSNIASLGIPLIEMPFLARALGVEHYGMLLFVQAIALTAAIFVEYGFHYSGARTIAQVADDHQAKARTVTHILTAKAMLYGIAILVILPAYAWTFHTEFPHGQVVLCLLLAAYSFSPAWYFLGKGNLKVPVATDLVLRSIGLLLIIFFARTPEDLGLVLLVQCSVGMLNSALPSLVMIRETGLVRPDIKMAMREIRLGWHFFVFKGASGVSASIATTVLGILSTPAQVGLFAPSEKLIRAGTTFVTTVLSAFFSASVQSVMTQGDAFKHRLVRPLTMLFCMLCLGACVVAILSSTLVRMAFGDAFSAAASLLQVMAFLVPFRAMSALLSILWLIPAGHEHISSRLVLANVVFVVSLGFWVAPAAGAIGVATVLALGEIGLCLATIYCVWNTTTNANQTTSVAYEKR